MPKFFVISDIHGFYDKMISALNEAGFDPKNENHWLISCGDNWDRGDQPVQVMRYLNGLERKVLIRGNHEDLFEDCCNRGYPKEHDFSNGTYDTILRLGMIGQITDWQEACDKAMKRTKRFLDQQVNYFETENYIFVHGYIPCPPDPLPAPILKGHHFIRETYSRIMENWREASPEAWRAARWLNGMKMAMMDIKADKTVVCGHYHTSYGHSAFDGTSEFGEDANFDIFKMDKLIAIDACTAYSGKVNVLVLEDDFKKGLTSKESYDIILSDRQGDKI